MNQRRIAITTGMSLILMAILAGFSIGYAYPEFDKPEHLEFLKDNIIQNKGLYYSMLIGILMILILDFIVAFTLYKYFEDDHKKTSIVSGILRTAYTVIFGIATYFLSKNLNSHELTNQMVHWNFQQFQTIWNAGLVVFGLHILLIGFLMMVHTKIPKLLCYTTLIAGISYVIVSLLKLESPNSEMVEIVALILALPMTLGELGLALWLWIKGGIEVAL